MSVIEADTRVKNVRRPTPARWPSRMGSPGCAWTIPERRSTPSPPASSSWFEDQVDRVERERPEGLVDLLRQAGRLRGRRRPRRAAGARRPGGRASPCCGAATS